MDDTKRFNITKRYNHQSSTSYWRSEKSLRGFKKKYDQQDFHRGYSKNHKPKRSEFQNNTIINYITYKMFLFMSDFNKARKMLEKMQNCILLSERMMFLLACTGTFFLFSSLFHLHAPSQLAVL